jgi:electron transfer flavoprotein alpha subunit
MRNSKTIIVINTDEEAPIIEMAHYAIIGDLHEVLPELMKQL